MAPRTLIAFALLFVSASRARADSAERDWPRWQRGYAMAAGATQVGDVWFAQIGLNLHVSVRLHDRFRAAVAGEMLNTNRDAADGLLEGQTLRGLLGLEWLAHGVRSPDAFSPRIYASTGAGAELITWDRGLAARPLAYAGVDLVAGFTLGDGHFLRAFHSLSFHTGIRLQLARAVPSSSLHPRCAGACMPYPKEGAADLAVMFTMGLDFGR